MFTAAELGMLTAQKQAKDIGPKRKAKSDAAEYKKMTKDIPEEFHDIRNDMHAWLKETGKSKQDVEKSAYAGTHPLDVITEKYFKKPKIEKESGELNMHTAADLGRLSAQMHHTKQAEGWSDLPSWLFSLGGHNPFFKQPQQGMGGPVVMPGLNGGRNQLPRQQNMGGPVVMPGFNGGGQPKGPVPFPMRGGDRPPLGNPVPFADDFFRKQPPPKGPVPFADNFFRKQPPPNGPVPPAFDLMPAIRGKAPKGPTGNGIKTMPAPVPTDKAPKTPVIQRL